jgi:phage terminase large subunit-like protein
LNNAGSLVPPDLLTPHGQGYKDMSPAIEKFEQHVLSRKLWHPGSPVVRWELHQAKTMRDPSGNRKLDKTNERNRIDTVCAIVLAISASEAVESAASYLQTEDLLVL